MQDVQMPSQQHLTAKVQQLSDKMPPYPSATHQNAVGNNVTSRQVGEQYVGFGAMPINYHDMTSDFCGKASKTAVHGSGLSSSWSVKPSFDHAKVQPMDESDKPPSTEGRTLSDCDSSLQARVNSTSNPTMIASHDLASTLASDIAKRLGLGSSSAERSQCNNKKDFEKAIQDSVDNLLGSNHFTKGDPRDQATRSAEESKKLFKCDVCSKKKKTQSDLT